MSSDDTLLARTYRLLDATNLTYRQISEGARVNRHWLEKFKQRVVSERAGVGDVQRVHDFLAAYEAIRAPQLQAQVAVNCDPSHPHTLGSPGNG